jgi:hypothetical protein
VIPTQLMPPRHAGGRRPTGPWAVRLASLLFALGALTGGMAWLITLSPLQLERWQAVDTSHAVTFDEPGTYLLFEEGPDAAERRGDPKVIVSVRSIAGRLVPVRPLVDGRGRSPQTYDVGIHQGRAIAAIEVERPGRYIVLSFSATADPVERGRPRVSADASNLPGLALGPDGEPSDWGTWGGLAVLAGVPALVALGLAGWARCSYPLALGPLVEHRRQTWR